MLAERAGRSARTIYRVMDYHPDTLIQLDLADRLLVAANGHLDIDCEDRDVTDG